MWDSVKDFPAGKKVVLFGSCDRGEGDWMRSREDDAKDAGITLAAEGLIVNNTPDDEGLEQCRKLGKTVA